MKKLFVLFLVLSIVFLTACDTVPPVGTTESGNKDNEQNAGDWLDAYRGKIVSASSLNDFIDVPSRIVFEATVPVESEYGGNQTYTFYYSKADGNAYVYCFDPLCDHKDCMACPNDMDFGNWSFSNTFTYQNRFFCVTKFGQLISFSFDGTDKKIEYDLEYEFPGTVRYSVWNPSGLYGPYLYISLKLDMSGFERELLRYNMETGEMENLTQKTGNYINPHYFYNGMIYGIGKFSQTGDSLLKADLDLNTVEILDESVYLDQSVGSIIVGDVYAERNSIEELPKQIGVSFYNIETGERRIMTKEELSLEGYPRFIYATEEYLYFYIPKIMTVGTITTIDRNGKEKQTEVQKMNDGKLYRMNPDGTGIVCVYDDPAYELDENMAIYGDKIVMQGRYIAVENGKKKVTINTVFTAAPKVLEAFEKTEYANRLKATGVITSYICPLMYMNNPLCKKMPVITSSNKLRTYTSARYYTDAEILKTITGGKL